MFETELKNLLALAATANTVDSCESYIDKLEGLKQSILRIGNEMGLEAISQINSIDLMVSKLDRKADRLDADREFVKRDQIRDERVEKFDKYKVKPVENEIIARKSYRK